MSYPLSRQTAESAAIAARAQARLPATASGKAKAAGAAEQDRAGSDAETDMTERASDTEPGISAYRVGNYCMHPLKTPGKI
jgi:hypothetical protein